MLHRARQLLVRQRTMLSHALRRRSRRTRHRVRRRPSSVPALCSSSLPTPETPVNSGGPRDRSTCAWRGCTAPWEPRIAVDRQKYPGSAPLVRRRRRSAGRRDSGVGPIVADDAARCRDRRLEGVRVAARPGCVALRLVPKPQLDRRQGQARCIAERAADTCAWLLVAGAMRPSSATHRTLGTSDSGRRCRDAARGSPRWRPSPCANTIARPPLRHHRPRRQIQGAEAIAGGLRAARR